MNALIESLMSKPLFVWDVESIGLHGEAFAVGYVVLFNGREVDQATYCCEIKNCRGARPSFEWVEKNMPCIHVDAHTPHEIRDKFWVAWLKWKNEGAIMFADCLWPVEARFLAQCVEDNHGYREWHGPYPFHEIASFRVAAGFDPLATMARDRDCEPVHHPERDARHSARQLWEALQTLWLMGQP